MKKRLFLFGAGASVGESGEDTDFPPLGNKLFSLLCNDFPELWNRYDSLFLDHKEDFESFYQEIYQELSINDWGAFQELNTSIGSVLFNFSNTSTYDEFLKKVFSAGNDFIATLNYDRLLPLALNSLGMSVSQYCVFPHGSSIFVTNGKNFKKGYISPKDGVFSGNELVGTKIIMGPSGAKAELDYDVVLEFDKFKKSVLEEQGDCIISRYSNEKSTDINMSLIMNQRKRLYDIYNQVEEVYLIGLRFLKYDYKHLFEKMVKSKTISNVYFVNPFIKGSGINQLKFKYLANGKCPSILKAIPETFLSLTFPPYFIPLSNSV